MTRINFSFNEVAPGSDIYEAIKRAKEELESNPAQNARTRKAATLLHKALLELGQAGVVGKTDLTGGGE